MNPEFFRKTNPKFLNIKSAIMFYMFYGENSHYLGHERKLGKKCPLTSNFHNYDPASSAIIVLLVMWKLFIDISGESYDSILYCLPKKL